MRARSYVCIYIYVSVKHAGAPKNRASRASLCIFVRSIIIIRSSMATLPSIQLSLCLIAVGERGVHVATSTNPFNQ